MEKRAAADAGTAPRHIILSGGSRGLGLALLRGLLEDGYAFSTFSRSSTPEIEALVEAHPDRVHFAQVDITDSDGLSAFVKDAVKRFGAPYGVINNSAIAVEGILATLPEIEVHRMLAINLEGTIRLSRLAIRTMLGRRKPGRILNISSIIGTRGYNGLSVYSATKAGMDGFSRSLAREVGRLEITVNSIAPGYMRTDMSARLDEGQLGQIVRRTPLRRLATTDDVVAAARFLLSDGAGMITGQTLLVDGGISC